MSSLYNCDLKNDVKYDEITVGTYNNYKYNDTGIKCITYNRAYMKMVVIQIT